MDALTLSDSLSSLGYIVDGIFNDQTTAAIAVDASQLAVPPPPIHAAVVVVGQQPIGFLSMPPKDAELPQALPRIWLVPQAVAVLPNNPFLQVNREVQNMDTNLWGIV
jgi:hypothetical protein